MLGGMQDYLLKKGWERFAVTFENKKRVDIPNKLSNAVSGYGPVQYVFKHSRYKNIELFWGLGEQGKPPFMDLSPLTVTDHDGNMPKSKQDMHVIAVSTVPFDIIYHALINGLTLQIKC